MGDADGSSMEEGRPLSSTAPPSKVTPSAKSSKKKRKRLVKDDEPSSPESSTSSSPPRFPYLPRVLCGYSADGCEIREPPSGEAIRLYMKQKNKWEKKMVREQKVPTLNFSFQVSCFVEPSMLSVRKSSSKACLNAAEFIVGVACHDGVKKVSFCSGMMISYDPSSKVTTVLTSARVTHFTSSVIEWSGRDQHVPNPKVSVQLRDGTKIGGKIKYQQQHYSFALIEIEIGEPNISLASFDVEHEFTKGALLLGRDGKSHIRICHGLMDVRNGPTYHRNHYMYVATKVPECIAGGAVLDACGGVHVVGMTIGTTPAAFVPSSILLKCIALWKKFGYICRPHIGLKVWTLKNYDLPTLERISQVCNTDSGVVVVEVAEGSPAEKEGIRMGDVIYTINGQSISDTIELESVLLSLVLEEENASELVTIKMEVSHVRKCTQSIVSLTVPLSDKGEIFPCLAEQAARSTPEAPASHSNSQSTGALQPAEQITRSTREPGGWGRDFTEKFGCPAAQQRDE